MKQLSKKSRVFFENILNFTTKEREEINKLTHVRWFSILLQLDDIPRWSTVEGVEKQVSIFIENTGLIYIIEWQEIGWGLRSVPVILEDV